MRTPSESRDQRVAFQSMILESIKWDQYCNNHWTPRLIEAIEKIYLSPEYQKILNEQKLREYDDGKL